MTDEIHTNYARFFQGRHFRVPMGYEPLGGSSSARLGAEFLSLPKGELPGMVNRYLEALETGTTEEWCQCMWQVHLDDVDVQIGHCRDCLHPQAGHTLPKHPLDDPDECLCCGSNGYRSRRTRRIDDEPLCPVHSKPGLILGFFEWAFGPEAKPDPPEKCTPHQWLDSIYFQNVFIRDNDGWTYSEWMRQEPVTKEEFEARLARCTTDYKPIVSKGEPFQGFGLPQSTKEESS